MFCVNCGKQIDDDSKCCCHCGSILEIFVGKSAIEESVIEENIVKEEYLFFENLSNRNRIQKILKWISRIVGVFAGLLFIGFVIEQFSLDEGYKFYIYIIRFMVKFALLMIIYEGFDAVSNLFLYKKLDLKKSDSKSLLLGCKILDFIMIVIFVYPFLFVSDATLAGWIFKFAIVGAEEFFFEFKLQIFAFVVRILIDVFLKKYVLAKEEE